jgi:hypothetical protein
MPALGSGPDPLPSRHASVAASIEALVDNPRLRLGLVRRDSQQISLHD